MTMITGCILTFWLLFRLGQAAVPSECGDKEWEDHPVLCHLLDRAESDLDDLSQEMHDWARQRGLLIEPPPLETPVETSRRRLGNNKQLPVVFAHGMGDSCFNSGFQTVVQRVSQMLDVYAVCIPTGSSQSEDTKNGYFLNMDASVDVFAEAIRKDPKLQKGFHAIGFSQGSCVLRGWIAKMNEPTVHTFLAVNGANAGVGAVPHCPPSGSQFSMCDLLMEQASKRAYTEFAQEHSFQANYWKDPRPSMASTYEQYSQLAVWNNEAGHVNDTLKENWAKTQAFVWVLATQDTMVWPAQGEQWGAPDPNDPFENVLDMKETAWYQNDLFGLKTADEAGKNFFESFEGDHLQFEWKDFDKWVKTYLMAE